MAKAFLTRRELFNAAHRLYQPALSDEANFELYGKCSNPNWHGHNYSLWVTIKGEVNPETGYVVNLKHLSKIIKDEIIEKLDHRNINVEVDFMKGIIPSTENLAIAIWRQIEQPVEALGIELHCIRIEETENNSAEFYGFK
jgi:6-pyruvoyltetrahydropterin/6-carboxytetrahydropterin synthase